MSQTDMALLPAAVTALRLMAPLTLVDDDAGWHEGLMLWLCAVQDITMSHTIMVSLLAAVTALCLMTPLAVADDSSGLPSAWRTGIATNYGGAQDGMVCFLHSSYIVCLAVPPVVSNAFKQYASPPRVLSGYTKRWSAMSGG